MARPPLKNAWEEEESQGQVAGWAWHGPGGQVSRSPGAPATADSW